MSALDNRYVDITDADFPARLKRFRHAAGLTRKHLSINSGVSERTIIKYENGHGKRAKDSTLLALCKALNITQEQLIPQVEPPGAPDIQKAASTVVKSSSGRLPHMIAAVGVLLMIAAWSIFAEPLKDHLFQASSNPNSDDHNTIQAGRFYSEGRENLKRLFRDQARESFRTAIKYDSTYAKAYVMLLHPDIRGSKNTSLDLIAKARRYESHLSDVETLFLDGMEALVRNDILASINRLEELVALEPHHAEAYRILARHYRQRKNIPKAIGCLNAALAADSTDGMSFNRLAYVYANLGKYDKALTAVDAYMKLSPTEPNPYDTRGDILAQMGRIDDALASYKTALERRPDFFPSLQSLGHIYLFKRDYDRATAYYRRLGDVEDQGARCRSRLYLACIPVFQGKLDDALRAIDHGIAEDRCESMFEKCVSKIVLKSHILLEQGREQQALREFQRALALRKGNTNRLGLDRPIVHVQLLSAIDIQRAKTYLDSLKTLIETESPSTNEHKYWFCRGWIEMCENRPKAAIKSFKRAAETAEKFYVRYELARAYLKAEQFENAVREFKRCLNMNCGDRAGHPIWSVKSHYYLALAHLKRGDHQEAFTQFDNFLGAWEHAEWEFTEIADAQRRMVTLSMNQSGH